MTSLLQDIIDNVADRRIDRALGENGKIKEIARQLNAKEKELKAQITEDVQSYIDMIYRHEMDKLLVIYVLGLEDGLSLQHKL